MAKGWSSPSRGSPTRGRSPAERSNSASPLDAPMTMDAARTVPSEDDDARGQEDEDEYEEKGEVDEYVKSTAELLSEVEELSLQMSRMGNPRPVEHSLAAELNASADEADEDDDQRDAQRERPPLIPRATRNADTPSNNKVLSRLGEEMRVHCEWMMLFALVAMAQAKWPVLGPELTQPINSTSLDQLVEDTALLLKSMGYRTSRPNSLMLSGWDVRQAGSELTQWKCRLRAEFGLKRAPGPKQTIAQRIADYGEDPSKVPLPRTPETKKTEKAEKFRSTVGTPYLEDSHMLTPKKGKPGRGCYDHLYDPCDEAELGEDPWDDRGDPDESVKAQIRRLSHDGEEQADTMCLEVRTHFSLDKIAEFEGKRYRSDASLQWLKPA
ncbi:uncharacterized protein IUM83_03134 [Phytophthora cinnamomi]|uniref:uncharacterized protein n=1 Tax=Phytophthora cinnamomi TaxID=4785 RepID=UPI00355A6C60|nr:hypothetical protein IUM83_03134 [Phytophthora cinnamomi]